jgi:hypothetical protein
MLPEPWLPEPFVVPAPPFAPLPVALPPVVPFVVVVPLLMFVPPAPPDESPMALFVVVLAFVPESLPFAPLPLLLEQLKKSVNAPKNKTRFMLIICCEGWFTASRRVPASVHPQSSFYTSAFSNKCTLSFSSC